MKSISTDLKCPKCGHATLRIAKKAGTKSGKGGITFCPACGAEFHDHRFWAFDKKTWMSKSKQEDGLWGIKY